jgi:hypothetical protein
MFVKLFGDKLALAPIEGKPMRQVLDLATGSMTLLPFFAPADFPRHRYLGNTVWYDNSSA